MKCLGSLCPPSLEVINTPRFVIRAGIIPYVISPNFRGMILGVKKGKYTDFGGGCKVSKMEKPFDCAIRELKEETGSDMGVDLNNITHVFVSGKKHPHQVILFVRVHEQILRNSYIPKEELDGIKPVSFSLYLGTGNHELEDSLKSIRDNLSSVIKNMT